MPFSIYFLSPPNVVGTYSLKWQLINQTINKSHVNSLRYFIIDGKSYPTYILNHLWGSIIIPFGGKIGTYTPHPKIIKWEILGYWQKTNYIIEYLW